jgi:ABC-type Co2+ transport system permease subunit
VSVDASTEGFGAIIWRPYRGTVVVPLRIWDRMSRVFTNTVQALMVTHWMWMLCGENLLDVSWSKPLVGCLVYSRVYPLLLCRVLLETCGLIVKLSVVGDVSTVVLK